MTSSIIARIIATIPPGGCKLKALRCVLHDVTAAQLDYAITGLVGSGKFTLLNRNIQPVGIVPKPVPIEQLRPKSGRPKQHPWRQLLAAQKERF